jgi:hypothetical protein
LNRQKRKERQKKTTGNGALRNLTIEAILKTASLLPHAFSPKLICESFQSFGYSPFNIQTQIRCVLCFFVFVFENNFRTSVACRNLTPRELSHSVAVIQEAITVMEDGELTEEFFDKHNIPQDEGDREKKPKDSRAVSKRRSVVLTNKAFQQRLKEQSERKKAEQQEAKQEKERQEARKAEKKRKQQEEEENSNKRKKTIEEGPQTQREDDATCLLCPATYYAYQDHNLQEDIQAGKHVWKQCL